jgi:hypothetical protein
MAWFGVALSLNIAVFEFFENNFIKEASLITLIINSLLWVFFTHSFCRLQFLMSRFANDEYNKNWTSITALYLFASAMLATQITQDIFEA